MASSSADSEKSVNVEEKAGFDSFDIVKCNGIPYVDLWCGEQVKHAHVDKGTRHYRKDAQFLATSKVRKRIDP